MTVKADPGGFPQRRIAEVPSVSVSQMREIQRVAQEDFGVDILQITEAAGRSIAELTLSMLGGKGRGQRVTVLAGGGNKGGAGICAVRHLVNWGVDAHPVFGEIETEMSFATRRQIATLRAIGVVEHEQHMSEIDLEDELAGADLVIDALVGYGLAGPPFGLAAALTDLAVTSRRPILAVDMPTGVNAATGEVHSPAIRATTTLILDLPKEGILQPGCRQCVGELYLADLGIPRAIHERMGIRAGGLFAEGPIVRLRR
ncbi:MAG: NAD(P)H-hydrate epimerase [Dehalococcoidia bacterium]|nr:NAD(P)H-hydrate epimerase [Dehalococcoidia bacterium]